MSMKISEEVRKLYRHANDRRHFNDGDSRTITILADALRDAVAEADKREFEATNHCITAERIRDGVKVYRTNFEDDDPRHKWQFSDWQVAAHERLMGEP